MKRLNSININEPTLADAIYERRWNKSLHYIDWGRFNTLAGLYKGGKFLDLGCFNSPLPVYIKNEFKDAEVWALDYAPATIADLQVKYPQIHYVCMNLAELPFKDGYFDYVVAGEVIEHLPDPAQFIRETARVVKKGGVLAISTPFEETISQPAVSSEHLWAFTERDIKELLEPYGKVLINYHRDTTTTIIGHVTIN